MIPKHTQLKQTGGKQHVLAEDQSRNVFCCGVKTWAKTIAIFGIIDAISTLVPLALSPVDAVSMSRMLASEGGDQDDVNENDYADADSIAMFYTLKGLFGIGLATILLVGIQMKKPVFLSLWLIAHGIQITLLTLVACLWFTLITAAIGASSLFLVILVALYLAFLVFCFWIVAEHRRELLYQQSQLQEQDDMTHALCQEKI